MAHRIEEAAYWALIVVILASAVWISLPAKHARVSEPAYCYSNRHGLAYPCREDPRQVEV